MKSSDDRSRWCQLDIKDYFLRIQNLSTSLQIMYSNNLAGNQIWIKLSNCTNANVSCFIDEILNSWEFLQNFNALSSQITWPWLKNWRKTVFFIDKKSSLHSKKCVFTHSIITWDSKKLYIDRKLESWVSKKRAEFFVLWYFIWIWIW